MKSTAVVALALLDSAQAFQAPAMKASSRTVTTSMFATGDTGVTPPLGVYDPLGLIGTKDMRRYEIMEIKHGRAAMLGFLHVILIHAGVRLPGYLSIVQGARHPQNVRGARVEVVGGMSPTSYMRPAYPAPTCVRALLRSRPEIQRYAGRLLRLA